jgi:phosphonate transport system substrate-binding protein
MKVIRKYGIVMLVLAVCVMACLVPAVARAEIKFGLLPRLSAADLYVMFRPLAQYLQKETNEKVTLVFPKDFDTFKDMVRNDEIDIGFANSLIYVQLKKEVGIEPLVVAAEQKAGYKFRGIIIARSDSGIQKLQDLRGKKVVFVDKDSAAGYIFQMLMLKEAGLDVHKDFTTLPFAKKHDAVVLAVFNKLADAGGIREDDLEKMKDKVNLSQIRIVGYSSYYPNWPVFASVKLDKKLASKIRTALLKLKPDHPEHVKILDSAKLVGFGPVADKDYDQLRHAAKAADAF